MAIILSLLLFLTLVAAIVYFGYLRYARPGRVYEQLGGLATSLGMPELDPSFQKSGLAVRIFEEVGEKVPIDAEDASLMRQDMIAAGFRSDNALLIFLGVRVLLCAALVLIALAFRSSIPIKILSYVLPVAAGLAGYFMTTNIWLDGRITKRQEELRFGLPDALDLMVVSVEAGLGLDQAIQYVGREMAHSHPAISVELQLVNLEIRAGKRRTEALRNLGERTREPEMRKLVAILIQTDRFGTSIADALRTHSDFMRVRRRQQAEERAAKVGVKLVFPIFFLILPSMMVVAAGPGLLQVFKYLFPMMKGAQF